MTLDVVTCNLTARQCFQSAQYNKSAANFEPNRFEFVAALSLCLAHTLDYNCSLTCSYLLACSHRLRLPRWSPRARLVRARYDFIIGSCHAVDNCVAVCVCVAVAAALSLALSLPLWQWGVAWCRQYVCTLRTHVRMRRKMAAFVGFVS